MKKKLFSGIAVLAVTATATVGALSYVNKGDGNLADGTKSVYTHKINTALGSIPQKGNGKTYYVSNDANPNGAGTQEDPADIVALLSSSQQDTPKLQAGDTVLFKAGKYEVAVNIAVRASGTYDNYITFKPEVEGSEVIIDFSQQTFDSTNRGVSVYGNYNYWYGIDITGAGDNGMYISGSYNTIERCEFYNNRDSGLQLGRAYSDQNNISQWPSYNLILNCTSHNNYDNETYGENADGFAAKLTIGYGNVFDGCVAYRNSDDGWDLYAKSDSGNIGQVIIYNCLAFENGYLEYTQAENNARFPTWNSAYNEKNTNSYLTRDGDGNGFKLGGSVMEGDVIMENCIAYGNRMHGVTDNSNPGFLLVKGVTSYNNGFGNKGIGDSEYLAALEETAQKDPTFGQLIWAARDGDNTYGNIDVSRQTYSYNSVERVVSAKSAMANGLDNDAVRGSVINSILGTATSGTNSYKITDPIDADTKNGVNGTKMSALTQDIFEEIPVIMSVDGTTRTYEYNLSGLKSLDKANGERLHDTLRNADGTLNLGNMFKLKTRDLLENGVLIGADLSKSTYGDYEHFNGDLGDAIDNETDYILARAQETLLIGTNPEAVYQDFEVPSKLMGATVTWSVDEQYEDYLVIDDKNPENSPSGSQYITVIVYRGDETTEVTLKATITYNGKSVEKEFKLNIMQANPTIGDIVIIPKGAEGNTANYIAADGRLIVDQYSVYPEPAVIVYDGSDYNGKTLSESKYTITSKYEYRANTSSPVVEVKGFTSSNSGIYKITKTVTMGKESRTMTYSIYVAGIAGDVQFIGSGASVAVYRDGYIISGDVSNPTGILYSVSSSTKLTDITKENIKSYEGVSSETFRATNISISYANENSGAYYIYYALANLNGVITSDVTEVAIYSKSVTTPEAFAKVAAGTALDDENPANTIYALDGDIDFTGFEWTASGTFKGLLNGKGHTIKNLTVNGGKLKAVFNKVSGGTIMNIKFNEIDITSGEQKVGLIGEVDGGYFYNIAMTNVRVTGSAQRVGGLIGQVQEGTPTHIDQISLINDADHVITNGTANRAAGIVGFVQPSSNPTISGELYISNCYVNAPIVGGQQIGGIIGSFDNQKEVPFYVTIDACVVAGSLTAAGSTASRIGGMVGYHSDSRGILTITNCISIAEMYYANVLVTTAQKNISGIMGGYTSEGEIVSNCVALMEEHNSNLDVTAYSDIAAAAYEIVFSARLNVDKWTIHTDTTSSEGRLLPPYVSLNFLGQW